MTTERPTRSAVPTDRLTRLADAATAALDAHPEHDDGDRCMVFISSEKDQCNGLVLHGYKNDSAAVVDLLVHLRAIFRANGKDLHVVPVGATPEEERS
jgi:hypothetical protein